MSRVTKSRLTNRQKDRAVRALDIAAPNWKELPPNHRDILSRFICAVVSLNDEWWRER